VDARPTDDLLVTGKVEFADGARKLRILRDGEVVTERGIPAAAPEVKFDPVPEATSGRQELSWTARHPEGLALWALLAYSNDDGETWLPASTVTPESSVAVTFDDLPGGRACRFAVHVSDGFNTATATSEPFALPPRPCRAMILAPIDGAALGTGTVVLSGQGWWMEEGTPETARLAWRSSLDADLGYGTLLSVSLSPGRHVLTLTAGAGERAGTDTVTVTVLDDAPA
jgi:hypothetical protein